MDMKYLLTFLCIVFPSSVYAESLPIKGLTGGGYGAFSWGTSLETVVEQTSRLKFFKDAPETVEEKKRLSRLKRARQRANKAARRSFPKLPRNARISRYEKWISINGLKGRADYGFFDGQLYQVVVRLVYEKGMQNKEQKIISRMFAKYGATIPDHEGKVGTANDNRLVFTSDGGPIMVDRLRPSKKSGLLRLTYQSPQMAVQVERYLNRLAYLIGRYSPTKNPPLPRKSVKRPSHSIDKSI